MLVSKLYSFFHFLTIDQKDARPTRIPTNRDASLSHGSKVCTVETAEPRLTEDTPTKPLIRSIRICGLCKTLRMLQLYVTFECQQYGGLTVCQLVTTVFPAPISVALSASPDAPGVAFPGLFNS